MDKIRIFLRRNFKSINSYIYNLRLHYDVTFLYPNALKNGMFPVGEPFNFKGNIEKLYGLSDYTGFIECDVTYLVEPKAMVNHIPLLSVPYNGSSVAPVGTWRGVYSIAEIVFCKSYNYKFKTIRGVIFKKDAIFSSYVNFMFNLKKTYLPGSPLYLISKLLLNGLYGRFGMDPNLTINKIVNAEESKNYLNILEVENILPILGTNYVILSYKPPINVDRPYVKTSVSIALSASITAEARVYMNYFKNKFNYKIYYTDTDSLFLSEPLEDLYVGDGTELGKFKFIGTYKDAVFIAPKTYGTLDRNDKEQIVIKGLSVKAFSFKSLKTLLNKNTSLEASQEKWFKTLTSCNIQIKDVAFTLKITSNKRVNIFDTNDRFIATKPIVIGTIDSPST